MFGSPKLHSKQLNARTFDAGERLAALINGASPDCAVLCVDAGGVIVGCALAASYGSPCDVVGTSKLVVPDFPEIAFGAATEHGGLFMDPILQRLAGLEIRDLHQLVRKSFAEADLRGTELRGTRPIMPLAGKRVILVKDVVVTGATLAAAAEIAAKLGAVEVVFAAVVGSRRALDWLRGTGAPVFCLRETAGTQDARDALRTFDRPSSAQVRELIQPNRFSEGPNPLF